MKFYRLPWAGLLGLWLASTLLSGCTTSEAVRVISSRDPGKAIERTAKRRVTNAKNNPLALAREVKQLLKLLRGNVDRQWGKKDRALPSTHRYVKYTNNYKSRAIINFDSGLIRVETVDNKNAKRSLRNAIITTLLTPDDPRAVDLYTAKKVALKGRPYLFGLVHNHRGEHINTPKKAEAFAKRLIAKQLKTRKVKSKTTARYVEFSMVNDHADLRAKRYSGFVNLYADRFKISKNLVYAIIKTESNFNPYAVSSAPAYGLMQLVPRTGGRDAFRHVKGKDRAPSREYLFIAGNNIELGTGYLNVLSYKYLKGINNALSREYCAIAAYNTGAGNVLKVFSRDRAQAKRVINSMSPKEVYQRLHKHLKHKEARRYLAKVTEARRLFVRL